MTLRPTALVVERPAERPPTVAEPTRTNASVSLPPGGCGAHVLGGILTKRLHNPQDGSVAPLLYRAGT
ncbi:hypothetical protein DPMN_068124 [Dreissena polymorpha]|uniref:Uncharacterized protein n=1 Tax=Dreissena polymorpha TaxID=45954 RepID=A0A9D3YYK7_DREPO|nr:hypothetical protein DPMN_068124 [Dreissena polymorpha]